MLIKRTFDEWINFFWMNVQTPANRILALEQMFLLLGESSAKDFFKNLLQAYVLWFGYYGDVGEVKQMRHYMFDEADANTDRLLAILDCAILVSDFKVIRKCLTLLETSKKNFRQGKQLWESCQVLKNEKFRLDTAVISELSDMALQTMFDGAPKESEDQRIAAMMIVYNRAAKGSDIKTQSKVWIIEYICRLPDHNRDMIKEKIGKWITVMHASSPNDKFHQDAYAEIEAYCLGHNFWPEMKAKYSVNTKMFAIAQKHLEYYR